MSILHRAIERRLESLSVPVALTLASGERIGPVDAPVTLHLRDAHSAMLLARGKLGALGSAVVEGRVAIEGRARDLMAVVSGLMPQATGHRSWFGRAWLHLRSRLFHSRSCDAQQIAFHYDVSDDFYVLWLDPRRIYSCAYFNRPGRSLAEAQQAKLDHVCRKLMLRPGDRFLDIGAGWGGLLLWAAEHYGVKAHGITLSRNQHEFVQRLIAERRLGERVRIELRDYRDLKPERRYDKIASVGMFENVGRTNMRAYFGRLRDLLEPGGLVMNHGITAGALDDAQVSGDLGDFIERYVFPGGELIHVSEVMRQAAGVGLEMVDMENLRPHYAQTLWSWSDALENSLEQAERILERGRTREQAAAILRAYRLYLAGCALAFERGWVSLHQVLATRPTGNIENGTIRGAQSVYPFHRDHVYGAAS